MEKKELESYRKAGKIASGVRERSKELVKANAKILDIAEKVEKMIKDEGGKLAFPVNVCINDVTAHYTPKFDDEIKLTKDDVVSIDLGVHIDGYIADTAYTIDLSKKYKDMLKANQEALAAALELMKPGAEMSVIGKTVHDIITAAGFKPIENLTGHQMEQYSLHAGFSVPNIEVPYDRKIEEGMVFAVEPFATDGYGRVVESRNSGIFSLLETKPTRNRDAREIVSKVEDRESLPFAERWVAKKIPPLRMSLAMRELLTNGSIRAYPTLHEKEKGVVSQFEHTIIITKDGGEVTTK
jgi:methionyl aminopeptidase